MVALLKALAKRTGRRGAFLAFLAMLDFGYGYSLLTIPLVSRPGLAFDLFLAPTSWGWIWISVGAIVFTGAFVKRDRFQFALASLLKTAWAIVYLRIWLVQDFARGWVSVIIWLSFAGTVFLISGWHENVPAGNGLPPILLPPDTDPDLLGGNGPQHE